LIFRIIRGLEVKENVTVKENLLTFISKTRLELFKSLFRGRQDVFALRREKGNKAAYRLEYRYNWMQLQRHIDNRGTFASFKGKKPSPLDDKQLRMHLSGSQLIGIYPLLRTTLPGLLPQTLIRKTGQRNAGNW